MATQKTSTSKRTSTAQANQTKKGTNTMQTTNLKDLKIGTILKLKPHTNKDNKGFICLPHRPKTYITATGNINIEYEKETTEATSNIVKYTDNPVISNDYQTYWNEVTTKDLIQINVMPIYKDPNTNKIYEPINYFVEDLLSQIGLGFNKAQDITISPEDIFKALSLIKNANTVYEFIVTENTSKAGNKYKILKPIRHNNIYHESINYSL